MGVFAILGHVWQTGSVPKTWAKAWILRPRFAHVCRSLSSLLCQRKLPWRVRVVGWCAQRESTSFLGNFWCVTLRQAKIDVHTSIYVHIAPKGKPANSLWEIMNQINLRKTSWSCCHRQRRSNSVKYDFVRFDSWRTWRFQQGIWSRCCGFYWRWKHHIIEDLCSWCGPLEMEPFKANPTALRWRKYSLCFRFPLCSPAHVRKNEKILTGETALSCLKQLDIKKKVFHCGIIQNENLGFNLSLNLGLHSALPFDVFAWQPKQLVPSKTLLTHQVHQQPSHPCFLLPQSQKSSHKQPQLWNAFSDSQHVNTKGSSPHMGGHTVPNKFKTSAKMSHSKTHFQTKFQSLTFTIHTSPSNTKNSKQ